MKNLSPISPLSPSHPITRRDFGKGLAAILAAGVAPALSGATTGGLRRGLGMRLASMGGGGSPKPYDFELQWAETNGTAYIDTGVVFNEATDELIYKCDISAATAWNKNISVGSAESTATSYLWIAMATQGNYVQVCYANQNRNEISSGEVEVNIKNRILKLNGQQKWTFSASTTCSIPLFLFARNYNGTADRFCPGHHVKQLKIIRNGEDFLDLIPVSAGGVARMFDRASGILVPTSGSGDLIAGDSA